MAIDDGLAATWDQRVRDACAPYRQGHLIERPPFFYVASAAFGIYSLTREYGNPDLEDELFESAERPPYGLITTETCDLAEEDAKQPRHPWISVAPVYNMESRVDESQRENLQAHRIQYMRLLDPPGIGDGLWVADLRIELPLEKSWLVGRTPIESLRSHEDYEDLARQLAARRERPVLSGDVNHTLIRPLRRWVERMKPNRRDVALHGIAEVRILFAGSPLNPDAASLLVLSKTEEISPDVQTIWKEKWESWKAAMDEIGVPLLDCQFETLDTCSARRYLDSFQIDLSFAL